ncbi:hypothetical protein WDW37_14050 [Bdellovibrionota bacterium FG-1]
MRTRRSFVSLAHSAALLCGTMIETGCNAQPDETRDEFSVAIRLVDSRTPARYQVQISEIDLKLLSSKGTVMPAEVAQTYDAGAWNANMYQTITVNPTANDLAVGGNEVYFFLLNSLTFQNVNHNIVWDHPDLVDQRYNQIPTESAQLVRLTYTQGSAYSVSNLAIDASQIVVNTVSGNPKDITTIYDNPLNQYDSTCNPDHTVDPNCNVVLDSYNIGTNVQYLLTIDLATAQPLIP